MRKLLTLPTFICGYLKSPHPVRTANLKTPVFALRCGLSQYFPQIYAKYTLLSYYFFSIYINRD